MTPGERQKWFGLRDPDTDRTPEVSVVPSPFGEGWHVMHRNVLAQAFPQDQQTQALGYARRLFEEQHHEI